MASGASVESYKGLIMGFLDKNDFVSARFWAEHIIAVGKDSADVETLITKMYNDSRGLKIAAVMENNEDYDTSNMLYSVNKAKFLLNHSKYNEAIWGLEAQFFNQNYDTLSAEMIASIPRSERKVLAEANVIMGLAFEGRSEYKGATAHYLNSFKFHIYCYAALDRLIKNASLTLEEKVTSISFLDFDTLCYMGDAKVVKNLYMKILSEPSEAVVI